MPLSVAHQASIILFGILSGVILGVFFDLHKIIRGINKFKIITAIEDILFWILSALSIFSLLLYFDFAFLNFYVYVCMVVSFSIYTIFISNKVVKLEKATISIFFMLFRVIFKNLTYFLKLIIKNIIPRS